MSLEKGFPANTEVTVKLNGEVVPTDNKNTDGKGKGKFKIKVDRNLPPFAPILPSGELGGYEVMVIVGKGKNARFGYAYLPVFRPKK